MKYAIVVLLTIIILSQHVGAYAQVPEQGREDVAQIVSEKYVLEIDERKFLIYYGFEGSFEIDISKSLIENPKVISMQINEDKKSLTVQTEQFENSQFMWIRFPTEMLNAENEKFEIFVNGSNKGYDLVKYDDEIRIGFSVGPGTNEIEIVGTHVIPEFGILASLILIISFLFSVLVRRLNLSKNLFRNFL